MAAGLIPIKLMRKTIINMTTWPSPDPDAPEPGLAGRPVEPAAGGTGPAGPEAGQTAPAEPPETAAPEAASPESGASEVAEPEVAEPESSAPEAIGPVPGPGLRPSLEAILLVADEPVPDIVMAQVVERPTDEVSAALRELAAAYAAEGRGFELSQVAGGWRFYTSAECAAVVERFVRDGQEVRLTQAALETLAVVAYRQPVSRARVSAVRGVNCDGVMRTLVLRGLVEEGGTDPDTGAILFRTTGYFLERLGLPALADLPELAPFLPDQLDDEQEAGHENVGS
jgi:segregation and condensation protein B